MAKQRHVWVVESKHPQAPDTAWEPDGRYDYTNRNRKGAQGYLVDARRMARDEGRDDVQYRIWRYIPEGK